MASIGDERQLVAAFVVKGVSSDDVARMSEPFDAHRVTVLKAAALGVALVRKFGAAPRRTDIVAYAQQLADKHQSDDLKIRKLLVEGLIRAYLGEGHLLTGLPPEELAAHQEAITADLLDGSTADEAGSDAFVDEALRYADQF